MKCLARYILLYATPLLLLGWAAAAGLGDEPSREYQIKAAFIYHFAEFVEWPADAFPAADSPLVIAVVGDDPFKGALEQAVAGKTVRGRALAIRRYAAGQPPDRCQILFVGGGDAAQAAQAVARCKGKPVLTVGESADFARIGGIVRFYTEDNKVRFEIAQRAAERAGLKISAKLLKLARIIEG